MKKGFIVALIIAFGLAGCATQSSTSNPSASATPRLTATVQHVPSLSTTSSSHLASLTYHSGTSAIVTVNGNRATLNPSDWTSNHVIYSALDTLNRTSRPNTAYLESRNVANDSLRVRQVVQPTGWHQKFSGGEAIINRGHLIAYSLSKGIALDGSYNPSQQSGDQNNLKNLFTQTAFSNQELQTIYEEKVRAALKEGKKVIYQVHAIFSGRDRMARGVQLQAVSTDGTLNFNVYLFNVQPGFVFNYADGTSKADARMRIPMPANASHFNKNNTSSISSSHAFHYHRHHW